MTVKRAHILFLIVLIVVLTNTIHSQFSDQHYLPVSIIDQGWSVDDPQYRLVTTETTPVNVVVKNPATNAILANLVVNPGSETRFDSPYQSTGGGLTYLGILMEGDGVFSVTGVGDPTTTTMGFAWVSKGRVGLGKEFRVFAPSNDFRVNGNYGNYYTVIASEACQVTFAGFPQGDGTYTLNTGECYTINAGNSNNEADFMDALITSTGNIAVLNQTIQFFNGGITASSGGSEDGSDMLVPTNMIGDHYVAQEIGTDYITVVGATDNTSIFVNGVLVDVINQGEYRTYDNTSWSANGTMEIEGSENFYCWQLVSNPQSGYVLLAPLGCGNNQNSSIVPTGNYTGQTLSIIANVGDVVSIGGNTLTPVSSSSDFDFYIETTYGGTAVHSITSNGPLNVTSTTYEGAGSTGATYAGWGNILPADTLELLTVACNGDSIEVIVNICGLEGKISAGHPISAYIGNPFLDTFAYQAKTLYTSVDLDSNTCEQLVFNLPLNIVNDSIHIVTNVIVGETLPLSNDSLASRCSPERSIVSLLIGYFDYSLSIIDGSCGGTGQLIIHTPYTYTYQLNNGTSTTDTIFSNLVTQTYNLEIFDSLMCMTDTQVLITSPPQITVDTTVNHVSCYGFSDGNIQMSPITGTTPFQYSLDGTNYNTASFIDSLVSGMYILYILDSNLCGDTLSIQINQPDQLLVNILPTNISCGGNNGEIFITPSLPNNSYTYSLNGNSFTLDSIFDSLTAGIYRVYYRDSNLCLDSTQITINDEDAVLVTSSFNHVSCYNLNDGNIKISPVTGKAPFIYSIDGSNYDTSSFIDSLSPNAYTIYIIDSNQCSDTLNIQINEPNQISASISTTDVTCSGNTGQIRISKTISSDIYTYSLDGVSFISDSIFDSLSSGSYQVYIRDTNSCIDSNQAIINTGGAINVSRTIKHVSCFGGTDGRIFHTPQIATPLIYSFNGQPFDSTSSFDGLSNGNYTIIVSDSSYSCLDTAVVTIIQPSPIQISVQATSISCFGLNDGKIITNAQGGTSPYTFSIDGSAFNILDTFDNLLANTYSLVVQDSNFCRDTIASIISQPALLSLNGVSNDISCFGAMDGQILVAASGGTLPYLYNINNGAFSNDSIFNSLNAGTYTIIARDSSSCSDTLSFPVQEPLPIVAIVLSDTCIMDSITIQELNTNGLLQYNWYINDQFSTGISSSNSITVLPPNDTKYVLVVADSNGCSDTTESYIHLTPVADFSVDTSAACFPYPFLFTNQSSYQSPVSCEWNFNGDIIQDCSSEIAYSFDNPGTYDVSLTLTDSNGCSSSFNQPAIVDLIASPQADFYYSPDEITSLNTHIEFNDLSSDASSFSWLINDSILSNNPFYTYSLTGDTLIEACLIVNNILSCSDTICKNIQIKNESSIYVPNSFSPNNDGINDTFLPIQLYRELIVYEFLVFDRWGELLFQTNNPNQPWDGINYKTDVYVWKVKFQSFDQTNVQVMHGHVTLVK